MAASIIDLGTAPGRLQALLREFRADTESARSGTRERVFASKEALARAKGYDPRDARGFSSWLGLLVGALFGVLINTRTGPRPAQPAQGAGARRLPRT